ncbi:MAG: porin [Caulobacteraceae bacterium]
MTGKLGAFTLVAAVATLSAGAGSAQQLGAPSDQPIGASGGRSVLIDVMGDFIYNSNVTGTASGASPSGIKPEDEIGRPSLDLNIFLPEGRDAVFLKGYAGYDFHVVNTQLNGPHISLDGGADAALGPCRNTLTGEYSLQQTQAYELPYAVKNLNQNGQVGLDSECGRPLGLGTTFAVSEDWNGNQSAVLKIQNHRTFSVSGGLAYRRPVFGQLSLFGQYQQTDFTQRFAPVGARLVQDGYQVAAGGVRYERPIGDRMVGIASVAYSSLEPKIPGEIAFSGITYSADLTYRFTDRLNAHADLSHQTLPSNQPGGDYSIADVYSLDVNYKVGPRLSVQLGGQYRTENYRGVALIPAFSIASDKVWQVSAAARYRLDRRLSLGLSVEHSHRDANLAVFSYGDTQADLSIAAAF